MVFERSMGEKKVMNDFNEMGKMREGYIFRCGVLVQKKNDF